MGLYFEGLIFGILLSMFNFVFRINEKEPLERVLLKIKAAKPSDLLLGQQSDVFMFNTGSSAIRFIVEV